MRKGVAIPYVIAIVLGIIVIGFLIYWFVSSSGKGAGVGSGAECTARKAEFCTVQTEDNWNKMAAACGNNKFATSKQCIDFCSSIIPNWQVAQINTHCR